MYAARGLEKLRAGIDGRVRSQVNELNWPQDETLTER